MPISSLEELKATLDAFLTHKFTDEELQQFFKTLIESLSLPDSVPPIRVFIIRLREKFPDTRKISLPPELTQALFISRSPSVLPLPVHPPVDSRPWHTCALMLPFPYASMSCLCPSCVSVATLGPPMPPYGRTKVKPGTKPKKRKRVRAKESAKAAKAAAEAAEAAAKAAEAAAKAAAKAAAEAAAEAAKARIEYIRWQRAIEYSTIKQESDTRQELENNESLERLEKKREAEEDATQLQRSVPLVRLPPPYNTRRLPCPLHEIPYPPRPPLQPCVTCVWPFGMPHPSLHYIPILRQLLLVPMPHQHHPHAPRYVIPHQRAPENTTEATKQQAQEAEVRRLTQQQETRRISKRFLNAVAEEDRKRLEEAVEQARIERETREKEKNLRVIELALTNAPKQETKTRQGLENEESNSRQHLETNVARQIGIKRKQLEKERQAQEDTAQSLEKQSAGLQIEEPPQATDPESLTAEPLPGEEGSASPSTETKIQTPQQKPQPKRRPQPKGKKSQPKQVATTPSKPIQASKPVPPDSKKAIYGQALIVAILLRDRILANALLDEKPDIHQRTAEGFSVRKVAAIVDPNSYKKRLTLPSIDSTVTPPTLDAGFASEIFGKALLFATQENNPLEVLLVERADLTMTNHLNRTALMYVCMRSSRPSYLMHPLTKNYPQIINWKDIHGNTALYYAAEAGNLEATRILLSVSADPRISNNEGKTPLIAASIRGHSNILQALMLVGVDPNQMIGGFLALVAAAQGHPQCVKVLLRAGANPNLSDDASESTPLTAALKPLSARSFPKNFDNNRNTILQLLLEKKWRTDPNKRDNEGRLPLEIARETGNTYAARLLERAGADPTLCDEQSTPSQCIPVSTETVSSPDSRSSDPVPLTSVSIKTDGTISSAVSPEELFRETMFYIACEEHIRGVPHSPTGSVTCILLAQSTMLLLRIEHLRAALVVSSSDITLRSLITTQTLEVTAANRKSTVQEPLARAMIDALKKLSQVGINGTVASSQTLTLRDTPIQELNCSSALFDPYGPTSAMCSDDAPPPSNGTTVAADEQENAIGDRTSSPAKEVTVVYTTTLNNKNNPFLYEPIRCLTKEERLELMLLVQNAQEFLEEEQKRLDLRRQSFDNIPDQFTEDKESEVNDKNLFRDSTLENGNSIENVTSKHDLGALQTDSILSHAMGGMLGSLLDSGSTLLNDGLFPEGLMM